jgi:hypothetical protein
MPEPVATDPSGSGKLGERPLLHRSDPRETRSYSALPANERSTWPFGFGESGINVAAK